MTSVWTILILRASGMLFLAGSLAWLLQRWRPVADTRWHRAAWGLVLLQGIVIAPYSLSLPAPSWWGSAALSKTVSKESGILPRTEASNIQVVREEAFAVERSVPTAPTVADTSVLLPSRESLAQTTLTDPSNPAAPLENFRSVPNSTPVGPDHFDGTRIAPPARSTNGESRPRRSSSQPIAWGAVGCSVWGFGVFLTLGTLVFHFVCVRLVLSKAVPARAVWTKELQELCLDLGLQRDVRLMVHPQVGPFLTWAPGGHRIVVPVRLWNRLSAEERKAVLHHELCHLRRGDLWISLIARSIVALHWFNPLAWYAARRFDEAAEWSCDALMANESPARAPRLAQALLSVARVGARSPLLATSAAGGPLFQRIRRLVSDRGVEDSWAKRGLWCGALLTVGLIGLVDLKFVAPSPLSAGQVDESKDAASPGESTPKAPANPEQGTAAQNQLSEYASRIVVKENESLRKFVALLRTPQGQILMADRAAIQAQNAAPAEDSQTQWDKFVAKHFRREDNKWFVTAERAEVLDRYVREMEAATSDLPAVAAVLAEVASGLDDKNALSPVLKRFLTHEAAAAFIYHQDLRSRLHPGIDNILDGFDQQFVRTRGGTYVIRPARRSVAERRHKTIEGVLPVLARYQEELSAWSRDLIQTDDQHRRIAAVLADPLFAKYTIAEHLSEDEPPNDERVEGMFDLLEEATSDTADGLKFDVESDSFKSLDESVRRFEMVMKYREPLETPLHLLAEKVDRSDALHEKLAAFLKTDFALMLLARRMDYLPVTAEGAAREWVAQFVTRGPQGKYEITAESPDDLKARIEDFFRQSREIRRRGRVIDEFAAQVASPALQGAMTSFLGKLELGRLVEGTADRPEVDGLQLWFGELFVESPEGLVLQDWAGEAIDEILQEAAEIEKELKKVDF